MAIGVLILLRHGQSEWNKKGLFTGWVDIPLSPEGVEESLRAGFLLKNYEIDEIYSSKLIRAQMTALLAMQALSPQKIPYIVHEKDFYKVPGENDKGLIPIYLSEKLNERHYGDLQGLNKEEVRKIAGEEQVLLWRRSYEVCPPNGESLKMTAERTLPYFKEVIMSRLEAGKNLLVAAHGNSLRAIIMELEKLSKEQVVSLEVPTGTPLFYHFHNGSWVKK